MQKTDTPAGSSRWPHRFMVRLAETQAERLRALAAEQQTTPSALARTAIARLLDENR